MKKSRLCVVVILVLLLVPMGLFINATVSSKADNKKVTINSDSLSAQNINTTIDTKEKADSNVSDKTTTNEPITEEVVIDETITEAVPVVEEPVIPVVYDGLTLEQLGAKLERNLNSTLVGNGQIFANYAITLGVDPYLALAIVLHETGCSYNCSYLTNACHNIGGQKGNGCGEYAYFDSLEAGIQAFLNNIYNNYYVYGLTNANTIGPKYAEDPEWSIKVNRQIEKIRNS